MTNLDDMGVRIAAYGRKQIRERLESAGDLLRFCAASLKNERGGTEVGTGPRARRRGVQPTAGGKADA